MPMPARTICTDWLAQRSHGLKAGVMDAALDPFRGYASALRQACVAAPTALRSGLRQTALGTDSRVAGVSAPVTFDTDDPECLWCNRRAYSIGTEKLCPPNDRWVRAPERRRIRPRPDRCTSTSASPIGFRGTAMASKPQIQRVADGSSDGPSTCSSTKSRTNQTAELPGPIGVL